MVVDVERHGVFRLDPQFLEPYRRRPVAWGYGALSWVVYRRAYSRDGEAWWQTCRRVIEGTVSVQRAHCREHRLPWDEAAADAWAREAYDRLWSFRWTPPGRGLWAMGSRHVYEHGGAALNNCGFVSTADAAADYGGPFAWMLHMSMLGVGVGFDTRGRGSFTVVEPCRDEAPHRVADSREGWAAAACRLLEAYAGRGSLPSSWDLSQIRPRGTPLRSFGGVASGPEPLAEMLAALDELHRQQVGKPVDARLIVDAMNLIGRGVVAGGSRRSAQIAFGEPDDAQFLDLKLDPEKTAAYRWASNNAVFAQVGMDYREVARRTLVNGEPGYFWLDNARAYGRMRDPPDRADEQAMGSNPCVEQTLWDRELCCLVETFPAHHDTVEDFRRTLEIAYLYAKTVTLIPVHDERTSAVMAANRRIGCSVTGIVQAIGKLGYRRFLTWCDDGYARLRRLDAETSRRLGVPRSIKLTSVKPSGTVSLLAGATPGAHWEHAPYYLRRLRLPSGHALVDMCRRAGYAVEPDHETTGMLVVSFPVHVPHLARGKRQVPLREKVDLAAQMQRFWADNQVSCTAELDPATEADDLPRVLEAYEDRLKGIVFLPATGHGYAQPPYEEISRGKYLELAARIRPLEGDLEHEHHLEGGGCEGGPCGLS